MHNYGHNSRINGRIKLINGRINVTIAVYLYRCHNITDPHVTLQQLKSPESLISTLNSDINCANMVTFHDDFLKLWINIEAFQDK